MVSTVGDRLKYPDVNVLPGYQSLHGGEVYSVSVADRPSQLQTIGVRNSNLDHERVRKFTSILCG